MNNSNNKVFRGKYIKVILDSSNRSFLGFVLEEDKYFIFLSEDESSSTIVETLRKKDIGRTLSVQLSETPFYDKKKEWEKAKKRAKEEYDNMSTAKKVGLFAAAGVAVVGLCFLAEWWNDNKF